MTFRAIRKDERLDEHFEGIPNKDLTNEEYEALDTPYRELVRESGLWEYRTEEEYNAAAEKDARAEEKAIRDANRALPKEVREEIAEQQEQAREEPTQDTVQASESASVSVS